MINIRSRAGYAIDEDSWTFLASARVPRFSFPYFLFVSSMARFVDVAHGLETANPVIFRPSALVLALIRPTFSCTRVSSPVSPVSLSYHSFHLLLFSSPFCLVSLIFSVLLYASFEIPR